MTTLNAIIRDIVTVMQEIIIVQLKRPGRRQSAAHTGITWRRKIVMKQSRRNEKDRQREAKKIRDMELEAMSSHKPPDAATKAFQRPAYQSISVTEYLAKKYGIGGDAGGQEAAEELQEE